MLSTAILASKVFECSPNKQGLQGRALEQTGASKITRPEMPTPTPTPAPEQGWHSLRSCKSPVQRREGGSQKLASPPSAVFLLHYRFVLRFGDTLAVLLTAGQSAGAHMALAPPG